ncbi:MAG: hypothetical protein AAB439_02895 [Patescibacteria group bacterium]
MAESGEYIWNKKERRKGTLIGGGLLLSGLVAMVVSGLTAVEAGDGIWGDDIFTLQHSYEIANEEEVIGWGLAGFVYSTIFAFLGTKGISVVHTRYR